MTPMALLEQFGSDAVRYWALNGGPGVDTAVDEGQMKVGRRLAIKILNVSKFVLGVTSEAGVKAQADVTQVTAPVDRAMLRRLADLVDDTTTAFDTFDYARALDRTERLFWTFCDDYVELVKARAYGSATAATTESARAALATCLSVLLRLFAPHLPFVTEEVWSWWQEGSVHRARWPTVAELGAVPDDSLAFDVAADVLGAVRKAKSDQRCRRGRARARHRTTARGTVERA